MTLTLVTLMGTVAGVLLGAALVGLSIRRRFARLPGAFRCKIRVPRTAPVPRRPRPPREPPIEIGTRWGRRRTWAVWVHDVLVVQCGLIGQHVAALPVRIPEDVIHPAPDGVRGLGSRPQLLRLRLDGGPLVELATAGESRTLLVGPFMAAAIPGLPTAPADRPPRRR